MSPERVYSMDDVVAAGYKKSKQFDIDTLPGATEAWYGFHQQRDIEVRVYSSHQQAVDLGTGPAQEVVDRPPGQRDALIPVTTRYAAYAVVGNLVLLCERSLDTCMALVQALE